MRLRDAVFPFLSDSIVRSDENSGTETLLGVTVVGGGIPPVVMFCYIVCYNKREQTRHILSITPRVLSGARFFNPKTWPSAQCGQTAFGSSHGRFRGSLCFVVRRAQSLEVLRLSQPG